jgi:hypothetical protein
MSEANDDATSAAEASAWLKNPVRLERRASMAQQLAEEPEWDGELSEEEAECEPCVTLDQLLR